MKFGTASPQVSNRMDQMTRLAGYFAWVCQIVFPVHKSNQQGDIYLMRPHGGISMQPMRQGDLILVYAAPINAADRAFEKHLKERQVLPHLMLKNDITEHYYRITTGEAELYQEDGALYLQVCSEAQLVHEVHGSIKVSPGIWLVWMQHNRLMRLPISQTERTTEPNWACFALEIWKTDDHLFWF